MGMLEDQAAGLTPDQQDKARALYMHSIDPENYPDPDAPEPIPMFGPGEDPGVQPEGAYTNNVQDEKVDDEDPFADAEYADESPSAGDSADEDDPFADAEIAPEGYASEEVDPDDPFAEAAYETPPEPEEEAPEPEPEEDDPTWQDYGRSVMSGGAQIGSGVGWLMRKMGMEKAGRAVQDRSAESAKMWMEDKLDVVGLDQKGLSPQARKALATEFLGEGDLGDKWDHAKLATAQSLLGTMAGMGLGGVFTKGLGAVGVGGRTGAAIGYGAGEAGVAAPSTGAATEEEVLGMGHEQLMGSLEYQAVYDGLSGLPEEERQQKAKALVADAAAGKAAAITSVTTFILSAPFSNTLGKVTGNIPNARGRVGSTIAGAGEEATQEFLQSGAETMASNLAIQQEADPTREITEGALESAVGGAAAGGLMGGAMGAAAGPQTELDQEASDLAAEIERTNAEEAGETEEAEDVQGPMPQTREEQEADIEKQAEESAGRVQDIENAQDSARERVLANGGDLLDAELEAAKVGADMGMVDSDIQRHINMVNRQTEGALTKREEEEKAKVKDLKTAVKEKKKAVEEDKAYEQKDKVSGIGQTGDVGYIAESPATDETVAGEKGDGVVRGNQLAEAFAKAANEAATSPENELAPPTPAQKEAGNYKKGHQRINGLDVTIENPAGSTREAADGSWKQDMKDHYGYIKGTESAEGKTEQLDVFVGDKPESKEVFVVDQINKEGNFDEHKVMMGYGNAIEARRAYARNYPQGFKVGKITTMSVPKFKEWLKNGDQTQPVQPIAKAGGPLAASAGQQKEVIQPKTLDGERTTRTLTAAEQAEQRIEQMPGRKVRYRLEDIEKQPKSPALKKFLEESTVQKPVYHGTQAQDIEEFRRGRNDIGIHVGSQGAATERLSNTRMPDDEFGELLENPDKGAETPLQEGEAGGQNILPVYISLKNPLRVGKDTGFTYPKAFMDFLDPEIAAKAPAKWTVSGEAPKPIAPGGPLVNRWNQDFSMDDVREWLQSLGYDGIVYKNEVEDKGSDSYILFEPNQIKSAVGNKGTYDAKDKRIRYRLDDNVDSNELRARLNKENDGFTVDNKTGKDKKSGFAAGLGKEKVFAKRPTAKQIDSYRKQHAVLLAEEGNYLGAWVYGGEYFMDVSKVYPNTDMGRQRAYEAGKSIGEFGVQDLSKSPEEGYIPIEYKEGEREAIRAKIEGKKGIRYRKEEADGDKYFDERAWKDAEAESKGNSRTTIIHISPDQFLRMAETLTRPDEQKAREVGMLMDEGVAFNSMPLLTFQNQGNVAKTTGHEGRHRALALKAKGVKSMPVRLISGEGGPAGAIRFNYHEGAVPTTMEGQSGGVMKFPWSPTQEEAVEEAPHEGRAFKNFFSAVTKGLTGTSSTGAPYKPVISAVADNMGRPGSPIHDYSMEYMKHRGKFDDHIAFSIPGYKEVQQAVGAALVSNYGNMDTLLDIGASEGSFAKAVTALSGMKSTSLDPNPDMERSFNEVSSVPGAEYSMTALGAADQEGETAWVEDDGTEVPYFDPMGKRYDVVHEAMVFQFVSNERQEQFKRVKELVRAGGLFITEEKVFTTNQAANEAKKNTDHKALYFEKKDLDAKSAEVLEGMHKNMVHDFKIEEELARNFKYVVQFWDSGNFKGYMASDSRSTLERVLGSMPSLDSEFSTTNTPRLLYAGQGELNLGEAAGIAPPDTAAFKKWFKDSHAADSYGKPVRMYHGTKSDFSSFKSQPTFINFGLLGNVETTRAGFFFTDSLADAESYMDKGDGPEGMTGANVKPVYLSMQNPLYLDETWDSATEEALTDAGINLRVFDSVQNTWELFEDTQGFELVEMLKKAGFDGAIFNEENSDTGEEFTSYVVFDSNQIKSAIGNRGSFSAKDPNILKRLSAERERPNVPMTSAKAKEVLAPLITKMPLLQPEILANPSEAPAELYNQMRKDGALKAKGVFDPETGKLYVFSENHDSDADVVRTLLHEGVAHKGLRYLLGDKFEATMNDVFKNGDQEAMARIARKYGLDPGNAEDIVEIAEEYVAYLAEHGVQSTVLQRVLAAVRQALRSVGVVKKWSDADLHALLSRSGRKLKGKPMRKAMITKSFVVEGTGEQVEIEISADVEMRNIIKRKEACEKVRKCIK